MVSGITLMALLLFLPAGTWNFPGAWRMLIITFVPMLILGVYLMIKDPELLKKRLNSKENEPEQKTVILYSSLIFIACFVLCGLDFRFGWTQLPLWLKIVGCVIFLLSYGGFAELLRENAYLSRTVEVQEGQKVIDTGMYGIVRHPMYAVILFLYISMPVLIGSALGIVPLLFIPSILIKRIRNEEKVLEEGLPGYSEYKKKVKYKLVPFIW